MKPAESLAMHRLGLVALALLLLALAVLGAHDVALSRRVATLEAAVAARDKADPLMAPECAMESRGHDWTAGESREHPCAVSVRRVLQAPQQFNTRWLRVYGRYQKGFEVSALQDIEGGTSSEEAIWVSARVQKGQEASAPDVVVGRFYRGPAGHLGAYFGVLDDR